MCIRHHTNCSVESVTERGVVLLLNPHIVFSVGKRSSGCRNFNIVRVCPGHRGWFPMVLKHDSTKPPLLTI